MIDAYVNCKGCGQRVGTTLEHALKASIEPEKYEIACYLCAKSLAEAWANRGIKTQLVRWGEQR